MSSTPVALAELGFEGVKVFRAPYPLPFCVVRSPLHDITLKQLLETGMHLQTDSKTLCSMFFGKLVQ